MDLKDMLIQSLKILNMTQDNFAKLTYVDQSLISKLITGKKDIVNREVLIAMEEALDFPEYSLTRKYASNKNGNSAADLTIREKIKKIKRQNNQDKIDYEKYLMGIKKSKHIYITEDSEDLNEKSTLYEILVQDRYSKGNIIFISNDAQDTNIFKDVCKIKRFEMQELNLNRDAIFSDIPYYINRYGHESYVRELISTILSYHEDYQGYEKEDIAEQILGIKIGNFYEKGAKLKRIFSGKRKRVEKIKYFEQKTKIRSGDKACTLIDLSELKTDEIELYKTALDLMLFDLSVFSNNCSVIINNKVNIEPYYKDAHTGKAYIPHTISGNQITRTTGNTITYILTLAGYEEKYVSNHSFLLLLKSFIKLIYTETEYYYGDRILSIYISKKLKIIIQDIIKSIDTKMEINNMKYLHDLLEYEELSQEKILCNWLMYVDRISNINKIGGLRYGV